MCTSPKLAWVPKQPDQDNKKPLIFRPPPISKMALYESMQVQCNKCVACDLRRALKQAVQLNCELKTSKGKSVFLTLTYDDEHLPANFSVDKPELQRFIKRLRKWQIKTKQTGKLRYKSQGEYGGRFGRPHYHLAAFNLEFPDLKQIGYEKDWSAYESELLTKMWGNGQVHLIALVFENCLYITTHHIEQKVNDSVKVHEKPIIHPVTGKLIEIREPEFSTQSSKPGIGKEFFEKFPSDMYPKDFLTINGQKMPIPKYFDALLKKHNLELYEKIKKERSEKTVTRTAAENRLKDSYKKAILKGGVRHL